MFSGVSGSIRMAAFLAAFLAASPGVVAATETDLLVMEADAMEHRGVLHERGPLDLFRMSDEEAFSLPELRLEARALWGIHFELDYISLDPPNIDRVQTGSTVVEDPQGSTSTYIGAVDDPLRQASLRSAGGQPQFEVRIVPDADGAVMNANLLGNTKVGALRDAQLQRFGGIERAEAGVEDSPTGEAHTNYITRVLDHPVAVTRAQGSSVSVQVKGDFIVELWGIDAALSRGGGQNETFHTGTDGSGYGLPADTIRRSFLRLFVEDGTLHLRQQSINTSVEWAMGSVHVTGDSGRVDLYDADAVSNEVRFPDGYTGTLTPGGDDRLGLDLAGSRDPFQPTASLWTAPSGFNSLPLVAGLLAVALVALALRSLRRAPPLEHMESALEAGAFTRAARLAGRILRSDPNKESAHLGRAIALSRTGRPERVVRDLTPFLARNDPSDGTLHYVLGLAYRDLGKEEAATKALSEAVRRTPALAHQVPEASSELRRHGPEGDAQGYT